MDRVMAYRASLSIARRMVEQGIITEEEYGLIDTILTKKYGLSLGSIYR